MKNTEFNKLTNQQKRIAVAKDALAMVLNGSVRPKRGVWVLTSLRKQNKFAGQQLCDVAGQMKCQVCQLGALFLADVSLRNEYTVPKYVEDEYNQGSLATENNMERLEQYFSKSQIRLIENAFEEGEGFFSWKHNVDEDDDAIQFGRKYKSAKKRMIAILENIIRNEGTFVPTDKSEQINKKFAKTNKYSIKYMKDGGEVQEYTISAPIDKTTKSMTVYAYGVGIRTFKFNKIVEFA